MNETNKSITFLTIAAVACVAAYVSQPQPAEFNADDEVGKPLAKAFDVEQAKRMKITRFDEDAASLSSFEVAQQGRLWTIPSKGGYPADAQSQMAEAVNGVNDREILVVASKSPADHAAYGVVDPGSPKLDVGQTGVGTRVTVTGEADAPLVDVIIGHEVKDAPGQHYVRRADQDFVYVVEIDPQDFSTSFEDWIEADLLKISPWDIHEVTINDYTAEMFMTNQGLGVDTNYQSEMTLRYDDADGTWSPVTLKEAVDPVAGEFEPFTLADDQQLDEDKLGELKNALDDLRIVDVSQKPEGLSANLKAGEAFMNDNESLLSLIQRGFAPVGKRGGDPELLASSGEVICTMKDGVEYVLRFGNPDVEAGGAAAEGAEQRDKAVNRYLFVMARFNEDAIAKPELEEVPELPAAADAAEPAADASSEDGVNGSSEANAEANADDAGDEPAADPADDDAENAGDTEPAADSADAAVDDENAGSTEADLVAERQEIEERNQRKLDEYNDKLKEGEQKVADLNARFGDWYYVISNDVFKKIHLTREDVVTTKDAAEGDEAGAGGDEGLLGAPMGSIPGLPNFPLGLPPADDPTDASADAAPSAADGDGASQEAAPAAEAPSDAATEAPSDEAASADAAESPSDEAEAAPAPAE